MMTKNPREFFMAVFAYEYCEKIWISFFFKFENLHMAFRNYTTMVIILIWDVEYENGTPIN